MIGAILSGVAALGGGIASLIASQKQKEQAENLRKQTMAMKPLPLQKEQLQKLDATKFAALAGLPTYELYKNALNEQGAQSLRNIRQTAPTGSAALEATTAVNMAQNAALNDLAAKDALAKLELQKEARTAMGEVGALKDAQRLRTDKLQMAGLEQVSKLENASTYNKQLGLTTMLGAAGKTALGIEHYNREQRKLEQGATNKKEENESTPTDPSTPTPVNIATPTTGAPNLDGESAAKSMTLTPQEADEMALKLVNQGAVASMDDAYNFLIQKGYKF